MDGHSCIDRVGSGPSNFITEHVLSLGFPLPDVYFSGAEFSSNINKKYNKSVIMPLGLKTGKASMQIAHRAQVMLYVLMLFLREHSASDLTSEENSAPEKYTSGNGNPSERTYPVIKLEGPDPTRSEM